MGRGVFRGDLGIFLSGIKTAQVELKSGRVQAPATNSFSRAVRRPPGVSDAKATAARTATQGLTLARFSAQRKRFVRDRGCNQGVFREDVRGY